jgi:hypothetical protein
MIIETICFDLVNNCIALQQWGFFYSFSTSPAREKSVFVVLELGWVVFV